jgi:predicted nucleic acid-binding protein
MPRTRAKPAPSTRFVLDCSVVLAWYFVDETDRYADAVAAALPDATALVPSLFHLELANILVVGERRKRSTEAQATAFLASLTGLPIVVDGQTATRAWSDIIALARSHNLSTYDAAYLELAMRESMPLATLDDKLETAAKAIGVLRFKP